jgi:3-oxoacyl-[acyl-carrier-protein] synthase-3
MTIPIKIAGIGRYLPEQVISNQEVERKCGLPAGWVKSRTGVLERRWVTTETNAQMAARAATEAIQQAGIAPDDLDFIINASGTQQQSIPDGAAWLQRELGLGHSGIPAFTVHATCLSFLAGLDMAGSLITSGRYQTILIASAEIPSAGINFNEPESAALMGDAAAAVVLTATPVNESSMILARHFETYSIGAEYAQVRGGGTRYHPNHPDTRPEDNLFQMNGPQLLKLSAKLIPAFLERLQTDLSTGLGSIDWVVPHQASSLGLRLLTRYGWPQDRILVTLDRMGNSVAASIPVTFYEGIRQGQIKRGDTLLLIGSGAGLSLGGIILTY